MPSNPGDGAERLPGDPPTLQWLSKDFWVIPLQWDGQSAKSIGYPSTQEVAQHFGKPLYELSAETNVPFAHVDEENFGGEEDAGSASTHDADNTLDTTCEDPGRSWLDENFVWSSTITIHCCDMVKPTGFTKKIINAKDSHGKILRHGCVNQGLLCEDESTRE
ncbi:hypothetical protein B0H10DRAFT_1951747 [Mycena sp. CBHHK59/15]|nr:hypothetical protein B0H10DRAFT_1951747 [Mycena sp. CBHHK59/15]